LSSRMETCVPVVPWSTASTYFAFAMDEAS
jgi:hypothetical protein